MEFRILGPLEVEVDSRLVVVPGARERALLALLLLHANRVVPADRLIDELWGEQPPDTARKSLQVRVAGLRKALGPELLATRGPGYLLHVEPDAFDLHRFERMVENAESEPSSAAETLREALALWRGPALADFAYEPFAQTAISRLEELRLLALERRIEADLALGRHADLVGELETIVSEHPLRERPCGQLMLALYRSGRQAEALAVYQTARRELVDELGIEPGAQLHELERAILRQDAALSNEGGADPERSILVAPRSEASLETLLAVAEPLASRPAREVIVARLVADAGDLPRAAGWLSERRDALLARGITARSAVFRSTAPAADLVRLATEQDVDLILVDGSTDPLGDEVIEAVLTGSPCDVAVLIPRGDTPRSGPVLVPFAGAQHDWTAIELGAWIAGAQRVALRLAGPSEEERDASRLLASASLAVQRALGVAAEPLLLSPGPAELVRATADVGIVVVGLSERWRKDGLGPVRLALARESAAPVLLVRGGLRPGGLAPPESRTRFTWSLDPKGQ